MRIHHFLKQPKYSISEDQVLSLIKYLLIHRKAKRAKSKNPPGHTCLISIEKKIRGDKAWL